MKQSAAISVAAAVIAFGAACYGVGFTAGRQSQQETDAVEIKRMASMVHSEAVRNYRLREQLLSQEQLEVFLNRLLDQSLERQTAIYRDAYREAACPEPAAKPQDGP